MLSPLGTLLSLMVGPTIAVPAPPPLLELLDEVEVTHRDDGPSGFQITFLAGRSGPMDLLDYSLFALPLLKPFNRVVMVVTLGGIPRVLMDGVITHIELTPSATPGDSKIRVTGEDPTAAMNLEEKSVEHPAQDETVIANKIILSYAQYGLIPMVIPPVVIDPPIVTDRTPVQQGTDLQYLNEMAERHGYVFYVTPGPAPMTSTAYWGPPKLVDIPQRAISVNMGAHTNATIGSVRNDSQNPETVEGQVQDRFSGSTIPIATFAPVRPPLAALPSWLTQMPNVRKTKLRETGLNAMQAFARAQGRTNAAADSVTVSGELDSDRYGDLLRARGIVGVRGAGWSYDGLFYVKSVTHQISRGNYQQSFTLTREGIGSTTPVVVP
jgi:hypothetical protein